MKYLREGNIITCIVLNSDKNDKIDHEYCRGMPLLNKRMYWYICYDV